jgi:TDG/mug DNA glycosylase family protein
VITGETVEFGPQGLLPTILAHGLDVVFVGAAPSPAAAASGHYYAGGRNRFWLLLQQSGFTPRLLDACEDNQVPRYGIGLTAILPALISTDNSLLPAPDAAQRTSLMDRLAHYAPQVVCYNGRDVYRMCHGVDAPRWGLLDERLGESLQFVVHSSSGRADRWGADRLYLYRELYALVRGLHGEASAITCS